MGCFRGQLLVELARRIDQEDGNMEHYSKIDMQYYPCIIIRTYRSEGSIQYRNNAIRFRLGHRKLQEGKYRQQEIFYWQVFFSSFVRVN
jgi:hypothetical protein